MASAGRAADAGHQDRTGAGRERDDGGRVFAALRKRERTDGGGGSAHGGGIGGVGAPIVVGQYLRAVGYDGDLRVGDRAADPESREGRSGGADE